MWIGCAVIAVTLWACSGLPGLLAGRGSARGEWAAAAFGAAGSAAGLCTAIGALIAARTETIFFRGPFLDSPLCLRLDALTGFFLVPVFLIGLMGSIYGLGYWREAEHPRTGRRLRLCYGLLVASMAMVTLAGDGLLFLFSWEVMALCAFFLVSTEEHKKEVRAAGWLYLVSTHAGTLMLFAMFALLRAGTGSFQLVQLDPARVGLGFRAAVFLIALAGFGFKAGLMPLHFWLPAAHASAPSHVSALMSGVLIKVGVYGLIRTLTLLPTPPGSWGEVLILAGAISALFGVLFAIGQHDLKRLLAYHSIENIGIIFMGLGLAVLGQARGREDWVLLGLGGCLLHVWNHGLFKSLLFLSAGSVIHAARTREIDRMGGFARRMPATALMFFIGAVAICGLPPLNGFVSELLIYLGLFRTLDTGSAAALVAPVLAMVGALAVACFVKAFGAVFLGTQRSPRPASAREASPMMIVPMALLAACCVAIGVLPVLITGVLERTVECWSGRPAAAGGLRSLAPLSLLPWVAGLLGLLVALGFLVAFRAKRHHRPAPTWDCGYVHPGSRIQYTASSFAQGLVSMFRGVLLPRTHSPRIAGPFPCSASFSSHVDDVVLDRVLRPSWLRIRRKIGRLRFLQQGSVQRYLLYILLILLVLMMFIVPVVEILRGLFAG